MTLSRPIIQIILQILLFITVHDGAIKLYSQIAETKKTDIAWGLFIELAVWLFVFISITATLLSESILKNRRDAVLFVGFLTFAAFHIKHIAGRPYRITLLLVSALIGLTVPFLIMQKCFSSGYFETKSQLK